MDLLVVAGGALTLILLGDLIARLLRPCLAETSAGRVGLAFLLGPGAAAILLFLLSLAHIPIGVMAVRLVALLVWIAWLGALRRGRAPVTPLPEARSRLLLLLLVLPVLVGAAFALVVPPFKDALTMWSLKALVLFEDGTVWSDDFTAENRFHFHRNYPLLVPLAQVFLFGLRGEVLDHAAKIVLPMAHIGAGLTMYAFLRARLDGKQPLLLAALWSLHPHFYRTDGAYTFAGSSPSGYADPMLVGVFAVACLASVDWLKTGRRADATLATLCLGLAVFTKNEGLAMAVCVCLTAGLVWIVKKMSVRSAPNLASVAPAVLVLLILTVPWLAFRGTLPAKDENYPDRVRLELIEQNGWRAPTILVSAVEEGLAASRQGLLWPLLAIFLVARRRRLLEPHNLFLLLVLAGMALIYFTVFVVSPLKAVDQIRTAMPRTFFHLSGPIIALLGALLQTAGDRQRRTGQP